MEHVIINNNSIFVIEKQTNKRGKAEQIFSTEILIINRSNTQRKTETDLIRKDDISFGSIDSMLTRIQSFFFWFFQFRFSRKHTE